MPGVNYAEQFQTVLCEHSFHKDDYEKAKHEWVVAGGAFEDEHVVDSLGRFSFAYYMMHFQHKFKQPAKSFSCICSHEIQQNCYIYNSLTKKALVVGNCCICKCLPKCTKTCEVCKQSHKRRVQNICVECEKSGSKTFKKGVNKGMKLIDVVKTKPSYIIWCFENSPSVFPRNTLDFVTMCYNKIKEQHKSVEVARWFKKNKTAEVRLSTIA